MSPKLKTPFAGLLPPLSSQEFEALKSSIHAEGVHDSIVIDEEGNILDGHHRYKIRPDAPTRSYAGLTEAEKKAYVLQCNLLRRNLSPAQKKEAGETARKIAFALRKEDAKKNTQAVVAAKLGVDRTTVSLWFCKEKKGTNASARNASVPDARVKVLPKQRPEVAHRIELGEAAEQVAADYGVTARQARNIATKERKQAERKAKVSKAVEKLSGDIVGIRHGDFREIAREISDNSVDLVLTDPPYDADSISLYSDLAELSARVLKPGGWCLAYSGHQFLPQVLQRMSDSLAYGWTFGVFHTGGDSRFRKYRVQVKWKPVVGFFKPPLNVWWDWFPDVTSGGREKDDHEWQQAIGEAAHFVKNLTIEGGVVLDPMCGSGTTCLAAKQLGRQWIGIEVNEDHVATARAKMV